MFGPSKNCNTHGECPPNIQPFWISPEPLAWPWCTLAASNKITYCASVNNHSPVGLVSRQRDAFDWPCVPCERHIHKSRSFEWRFLAFGKARSRREPNLGCRGADRPGWCYALPEETCTRAVEWSGALSWWSWSARSVMVNAKVTQYTRSVNGVSLSTD
jgi:hypothetical protein